MFVHLRRRDRIHIYCCDSCENYATDGEIHDGDCHAFNLVTHLKYHFFGMACTSINVTEADDMLSRDNRDETLYTLARVGSNLKLRCEIFRGFVDTERKLYIPYSVTLC
jgi:hypothetical protein